MLPDVRRAQTYAAPIYIYIDLEQTRFLCCQFDCVSPEKVLETNGDMQIYVICVQRGNMRKTHINSPNYYRSNWALGLTSAISHHLKLTNLDTQTIYTRARRSRIEMHKSVCHLWSRRNCSRAVFVLRVWFISSWPAPFAVIWASPIEHIETRKIDRWNGCDTNQINAMICLGLLLFDWTGVLVMEKSFAWEHTRLDANCIVKMVLVTMCDSTALMVDLFHSAIVNIVRFLQDFIKNNITIGMSTRMFRTFGWMKWLK